MSLASPRFRSAIRRSIARILDMIDIDMQICQAEGTVRSDLPSSHLATMIWDYWQGALLRMRTEGNLLPLYHSVEMLWEHILPPAQHN